MDSGDVAFDRLLRASAEYMRPVTDAFEDAKWQQLAGRRLLVTISAEPLLVRFDAFRPEPADTLELDVREGADVPLDLAVAAAEVLTHGLNRCAIPPSAIAGGQLALVLKPQELEAQAVLLHEGRPRARLFVVRIAAGQTEYELN